MYSLDKSYPETPELLRTFSRTMSNQKSKPRPPPSTSFLSEPAIYPQLSLSDDFQIVVFGYKEKDKPQVVQKLSKFGILDEVKDISRFVMGVRFKDPKVAAKASSLNGQVVLENTMIGVNLINKSQSAKGTFSKYQTCEDSFVYVQKRKLKQKMGVLQKFKYFILNIEI